MTSERLEKIAASKLLAREYDSYTATELGKLPPAEYQRLRAGKVEVGELPQQNGFRQPGLHVSRLADTPAEPLSDQELALMLKYSKEEVARFYVSNGDKKNPDYSHIIAKKIDANDPSGFVPRSAAEQLEIRNAAVLHGIIEGKVRFPAQEPKPTVQNDERVNAGELGKLAGLPPDARVTPRQYNDLLAADARRLAARTPEQITQDRVAELRAEADRVQASLGKAQ